MMTAALDLLPKVRGTYAEKAPLKDLVWFRAGGAADILFRPADVDDLCTFMAEKPADLPVSVIGVGSNLLIRDGGIPGVVIRLPSAFGRVEPVGPRVRIAYRLEPDDYRGGDAVQLVVVHREPV